MEQSQRLKTIVEFITNNPDCNKEKVIKYMDGKASRVTTTKDLNELENDGQILVSRQKQNSRDVKLRINTGSILVLITRELEGFEKAFVTLLNKVRDDFNKTYSDIKNNRSSPPSKEDLSRIYPILELMTESVHIFYEVLDSYLVRFLMPWSNKVQDKDVLKKLYSIVFTKISDIQLRLYQVFGSTLAGNFNPPLLQSVLRRIYATEHLKEHYENFSRLNMKNEISTVLDCMWKINSEFKAFSYPEPLIYKWNFDYDMDNWRKLLSLQKKHPCDTYRNSIEDLLKLNNFASSS